MRVFKVEAESVDAARADLATQLGVDQDYLKCVKEFKNQFSFEALCCPPIVEIDIAPDGMKARIKRIERPIGEGAPKLTTDFVIQKLKEKGVVHGLLIEVITESLFKIVSDPKFKDGKLLNIVVAEGTAPTDAQGGRPQWKLDLKLFEKKKPVFVKRGEVLAVCPIVVEGQDGKKVTGEAVPFNVEDQFQLQTGKGIAMKRTPKEVQYVAESVGQLFFDQGIRLRLEVKIVDLDDGLRAAIVIDQKSVSGKRFTPKELIASAKDAGVSFGLLSEKEVQENLDKNKKWPAQIVVAQGKKAVDGKPGKVKLLYKKPKSDSPLDLERAKSAIVFPGEAICEIESASEPEDGMTVFGESLRGRSNGEQAIYPGDNTDKERQGETETIRSRIYGKVVVKDERIHVRASLKVSEDAMKATLDIFPQQQLSFEDVSMLLREKDVLIGFNKDKLETQLEQIFKSKARQEITVAQGQPFIPGKNAKLRYYFKPDDLKEKGLLVKSAAKDYYASPGDLLLVKFIPIDAQDGYNLYREKRAVPKSQKSVDVEIKVGKNIIEKEVGKYGDAEDPARIEYRSATFGYLTWANRSIDVKPILHIHENEEYVKMPLRSQSDFGKRITLERIHEFAKEEGIRVKLEEAAIKKALLSNEETEVEIAKSIPAKNGKDSVIDYNCSFNGEDLDNYLSEKIKEPDEVLKADCLRPKDIIASKTPAGNGEDGQTVFGRRIVAERGVDLPWQIGYGVDRSEDGNKILNGLSHPAFLFIQEGRIVMEVPISIAPDKMSATMKIYPSTNPRFQAREDKVMAMLQGKGISAGIKAAEIREAIQECLVSQEPVEVQIAEGVPAGEGREATYRFAFEVDEAAEKTREDGSIDHKAGGVFQQVKEGQLLLVKQPPTRGADGFNILDEKIPGYLGADHAIVAREGVKVSSNELEYFATRDGIVEFSGTAIRVIEGILVSGDVDFSTGNIDAGAAKVMIRGSVLPGFNVSSESEVIVDKIAEACNIQSAGDIRIAGGIIGKEKAVLVAGGNLESLYINSGATVEVAGDVVVNSEILTSEVRAGGSVTCNQGAGTVSGGNIWVFEVLRASILGAQGSEKATQIHMGVNYMSLQAAKSRIEEEGLSEKESEMKANMAEMDSELRELYDRIPEVSKESPEEAAQLQQEYRDLYQTRKELESELQMVQKQIEVIMRQVPRNPKCEVIIEKVAHPGTTFIYEDVEWTLKDPLGGVVVSWNETSRNFTTRRN